MHKLTLRWIRRTKIQHYGSFRNREKHRQMCWKYRHLGLSWHTFPIIRVRIRRGFFSKTPGCPQTLSRALSLKIFSSGWSISGIVTRSGSTVQWKRETSCYRISNDQNLASRVRFSIHLPFPSRLMLFFAGFTLKHSSWDHISKFRLYYRWDYHLYLSSIISLFWTRLIFRD